jgi:hypothetical protein
VEELDEADIAFGETAGEETVGGVGAGAFDVGAVAVEDLGGFFGDIS